MVPRSVRCVPNETMQQTGRGVIALHVGAGSGEEGGGASAPELHTDWSGKFFE